MSMPTSSQLKQTQVVRAQKKERAGRIYAENIIDTVREPLVILNDTLCVERANQSFYRTFEVAAPETKGRPFAELGNAQWAIPRLTRKLKQVIAKDLQFQDFEITHSFEHIGRKTMLLNARQVAGGRRRYILLAIEDITERKRNQVRLASQTEQLQRSNEELEQFA